MAPERNKLFLEKAVINREVFIPRTPQGFEEKSFILFDIDGKEKSLLTRKVELFCLPTLVGFGDISQLTYSQIYLQAWESLKDRGLRVVPDVWAMNENKVATTNLVEDDGSVYDQKIDAIIERDPLDMDTHFVKISFSLIQKEAQILVNLANKSGVELMTDGPFHLVINPDISWYLLLLDIGKVRIYANPKELTGPMKHDNQFFVDKALRTFAKIQENIRALRDARGLK